VKKFNNLVVGIVVSVPFGCCATFAGEVVRIPMALTVVDDTMKPVSGVRISGNFVKGVENRGFFSSSNIEEAEIVKCVTDDS